jgi:DNA invertase Pin-like site-specific DNA recombinase
MTDKPPDGVWALYARVSKGEDQTNQNQLLQLFPWAEARGIKYEVHQEAESSRNTRPVKEALLRRLRTGELHGIAFVSLSRWGRSTTELVGELRELDDLGRGVVSLKEGLNFATAAGKAFLGMLAVFAEFERDLVRERTLAGLRRVEAQGKRLGPPRGNQNARKHPKRTPPANPPVSSPVGDSLEQTNVRFVVSDVATVPKVAKESRVGVRPFLHTQEYTLK